MVLTLFVAQMKLIKPIRSISKLPEPFNVP